MIQDSQYTTVQEVIGQAALFKANRKEVNNEPQKPFDSWMEINTVQRYTRVWKQLLCYLFRAEDEELSKRLAYKLTGSQQIAIHKVKEIIQEFQKWKEGQPIETEDGDESEEEIEFKDRIQREILRLCIALLNHPLQDNEYKSAIISGLAVLGIRDDDGWLDAEDYTPKYSAVIKLARLMVVQEGYEQRQETMKQLQERGLQQMKPANKHPAIVRLGWLLHKRSRPLHGLLRSDTSAHTRNRSNWTSSLPRASRLEYPEACRWDCYLHLV
jgi:hypothetical protein